MTLSSLIPASWRSHWPYCIAASVFSSLCTYLIGWFIWDWQYWAFSVAFSLGFGLTLKYVPATGGGK